MHRLWLCFVLFLLVVSLSMPAIARAGPAITILDDRIISDFPNKLTFHVRLESSSAIQKVILLYHTNGATCQESVAQQEVDITPGDKVTANWDWDFTLAGVLPPGAQVSWQWQVENSAGDRLLSEERTYRVNDPRHTWKTLQSSKVFLQWYEGDGSFGQALLNTAEKSLVRLAKNAGVSPSGTIWITIYPTVDELLKVDIHASEWAGGIAYPSYNSTILAVGTYQLGWSESAIPHELAHLVTDAVVFNCRGMWLPTWLSEGLAVYAEGEIPADYHDPVLAALQAGKLPPLRTLESGFSSVPSEAILAYGHSGMVVTYLIDQFGAEKMAELLAAIQGGKKIDKALLAVYNLDTDGLEAGWRISLGFAAQPTLAPTSSSRTAVPTMALWTSAVRSSPTPTSAPSLTPSPNPPSSTPLIQATLIPSATPGDLPASPGSTGLPSNTRIILFIALPLAVLVVAAAIFLVLRKRRNQL